MEGDFRVGESLVQPKLNRISAKGATSRVEPKVMQVLVHLAEHAGDVIEKERLIRAVWPDTFVTDDVLTRAIAELRRALDDDSRKPRFIETIPKRGYRLIAPLEGLTDELPVEATAEKVAALRFEERPVNAGRAGNPQKARRPAVVRFAPAVALLMAVLSALAYQHFRNRDPIDSIAVLPFVNASADQSVEYLSDGIALSITNSLSQLTCLKVISQASAFAYKGQKVNPHAVGQQLGARGLLMGRLVKDGDRLMVNVELIDARDNSHIWGQEYAYRLSDILTLQEGLAKDIAANLRLRLTGEQSIQLSKRYTENSEAYQLYLKGRYFWNKRTQEGLRKSIDCFRQAIEKDPKYALAYAGLADSYDLLSQYGVDLPRNSFPKAKAAALKALKLDDSLGEAHAALAMEKESYEWDRKGAEQEYKRAIELDPGYATAHQWYSTLLEGVGKLDEAKKEIERARELDPVSLIINLDIAEYLLKSHQYDQAREQVQKVFELDPNFYHAHLCLAEIYMRQGNCPLAQDSLQTAVNLEGDNLYALTELGRGYARCGKKQEAMKVLATLQRRTGEKYVSPSGIAMIYAELGDKTQAFDWLEKALRDRDDNLLHLEDEGDPEFASLRSDPRFADLQRRMGQRL